MTSRKMKQHGIYERAVRLRPALGLRPLAGFCAGDSCSLAWYDFPGHPQGSQRRSAGRPAQFDEPPTIVALHSLGSGSREFQPLTALTRFRTGFETRIVCLDWPSHARSPLAPPSALALDSAARSLRLALTQLGIPHPILLGCGFGAAVALRYAATVPNSPLGLVLCQPGGLVRPRHALRPLSPSLTGSATARRHALRLLAVAPACKTASAGVEHSLAESMPSQRAALSALSCPTLFALSRSAPAYRLEDYLRLLDAAWFSAPQHRITVFEGAFHPLWDEPERFAQALHGFVQAQLPLSLHRHAWLLTAVDWPARSMNLWRCVHQECHAEQVLPEGQNANDIPRLSKPTAP